MFWAANIDSTLWFGQTDLLNLFAHKEAEIVHSQLVLTEGAYSVMCNEDRNRGISVETSGIITLLTQKPLH